MYPDTYHALEDLMDKAKIFMTGRSQAVRLPKAYRFDCDEVVISQVGDMVVLYPEKATWWDSWVKCLGTVTDDFMVERDQPTRADARPEP